MYGILPIKYNDSNVTNIATKTVANEYYADLVNLCNESVKFSQGPTTIFYSLRNLLTTT